jgi:L-threonylcarbamoyladenylate synthase
VDTKTRRLVVDPDHPDDAALKEAAAVLRAGGLVAFPTETVYGLGADATNPQAVARIYAAKGRPPTNPLIVHSHDVASIRESVAIWPSAAAKLAERFWPGPLTLVLPRSPLVTDAATAGQETVGVRVPDCTVARRLFVWFGSRPVAAPSANRSTQVSPTRAEHVLKDLDGRIDLILDSGPTPIGIESTVLDLTTEPPRLLRPGAISAAQIASVLGVEISTGTVSAGSETALSSPGQMAVHYAPRARVALIGPEVIASLPAAPGERYAVLVAGHELPADGGTPVFRVDWLDPALAARELYATLHRADEEAVDFLYVVLPPREDAWLAVRDRLWRASRRWCREGASDPHDR